MHADRPVVMPEDEVPFRLAQLLLDAVTAQDANGTTLGRIGYYDFLSANPFLVVPPRRGRQPLATGRIRPAGPGLRVLLPAVHKPARTYPARPGAPGGLRCYRIRNRDGSLTYSITEAGQDLGGRFTATYATSFTTASGIVVRQLRKLTDKRLREQTARWLRPDGPDGPAAALMGVLGPGPVLETSREG
ncbi:MULTISPECIES: hypothetical protein [unclassified Streptomyces]|uniref:hypothetical protein n=1 Tax=unclassified Streptomyces TaxID=2593676 RepID=UPI00081EACB9|nr:MULTISPECIES: hypothetical protein [unclassified Streptomyces]SCE01831.1 hypothetical protein GA0115243_105928 [Streptomyces sp. ScaeMP-e83]